MLTNLEVLMLTAIRDSEFHNGADPIENETWNDTTMEAFVRLGGKKAQAGGVMASLCEKGFAWTTGHGREDVCAITRAGFEALSVAALHPRDVQDLSLGSIIEK